MNSAYNSFLLLNFSCISCRWINFWLLRGNKSNHIFKGCQGNLRLCCLRTFFNGITISQEAKIRIPLLLVLRENPPEILVTSGQKLCIKIICIILQSSMRLFQMFSQKKSFLMTSNVKNKFWSSYETLESTGEMMMKFYLHLHSCYGFEIYFLEFLREIVFGVNFGVISSFKFWKMQEEVYFA